MATVTVRPRGDLIETIGSIYRQCAGKWTGCDWQTDYGSGHLDLAQLTSAQVLLLARATAGQEAADWQQASQWLLRIEQAAHEAENAAGIAWVLVSSGQFREALHYALQARTIEATYHNHPVWHAFCQVLEQMMVASGENY